MFFRKSKQDYFYLLDKYIENEIYTICACGDNSPSKKEIKDLEKKIGYTLPDDFKDFTMSSLGGLYVEVKEEFWPRAKEYEVGPFWSFLYGIVVYGIAKDVPEWMDIRSQIEEFRKESGSNYTPFMKVIGDANIYCFGEDKKIYLWNHEIAEFEDVNKSFIELLDYELSELKKRKNKKIEQIKKQKDEKLARINNQSPKNNNTCNDENKVDLNCPRCNKPLPSSNALLCRECSFKWYQCPKCNEKWVRGSKECKSCNYNIFEDKSLKENYERKEKQDSNYIDKEFIERLNKIDWFSNCGKPLKNVINYEVDYVKSWTVASKMCRDVEWSNITLEANNELTAYLHKHFPEKYHNKWNKIVSEAKTHMERIVYPKIRNFQTENNLDDEFYNSVIWDVLGIVMAYAYKECKEPSFYTELLKVYESGNFPCGWKGKWPKGKLVVY